MSRPLNKISRSQLYSVTMMLLKKQGGVCLVCEKEVDVRVQGRSSAYVVDHCHETGEVRGVLHRSCNAALGKIDNAAGRWGAKSMKYEDIIPYLKKVVAYYDYVAENGTGLEYPDHKSPEQKAEANKLKRRKAYAANKAKEAMAKRKQVEK